MKYGKQAIFLYLLIAVALSNIPADYCPVLCANDCSSGSACSSCYNSFLSNATTGTNQADCNCPASMYTTSTGDCGFCPIRCLSCSSASNCTSCIPGYMISNSFQCIPSTTNDNNWVSKNVSVDWMNPGLMGVSPLVILQNSQLINVTQQNVGSLETQCSGLGSAKWFGGFGQFDYTTKIYKTVYNLPPHQWINIRFQAILIDNWQNNSLVLELNQNGHYNPNDLLNPQQIWTGTFDSSLRFKDLCGNGSIPDNLVVVDAWVAHSSSLAKFQIRLQSSDLTFPAGSSILSASFAAKEVLVRVGTCGRNCEFCSSPTLCTQCISPYYLVNGACVCDSQYNLGFPTTTGCSPNCI